LVFQGDIDILKADLRVIVYRLRRSPLDLWARMPGTPAMVQRFSNPWARTRSHRTEGGFMIGGTAGGLAWHRRRRE
jgi:hypothetical protein